MNDPPSATRSLWKTKAESRKPTWTPSRARSATATAVSRTLRDSGARTEPRGRGASERAWDAEASENFADEKGSGTNAYENGLDARLEMDGDAYEASLRGDLDVLRDAERGEARRGKIARRREHARDMDLHERKVSRSGDGDGTGTRGDARGCPPGAARRGGEGGTNPPDSYLTTMYPTTSLPGRPAPRPFTDYDYAPYDYDYDYGDYDYAGRGRRGGGAGTEARRGRGRGSVSRIRLARAFDREGVGRDARGRSSAPSRLGAAHRARRDGAAPPGVDARLGFGAPASGAWRTCSSRL